MLYSIAINARVPMNEDVRNYLVNIIIQKRHSSIVWNAVFDPVPAAVLNYNMVLKHGTIALVLSILQEAISVWWFPGLNKSKKE